MNKAIHMSASCAHTGGLPVKLVRSAPGDLQKLLLISYDESL